MKSNNKKNGDLRINWTLTILPLLIIFILCLLFIIYPKASSDIIESLRHIFVGKFGSLYMIFGLGMLLVSIWLAFSKYGKIKLGDINEPRYKDFSWGAMIFTSAMAADILYWSLIEWAYYFNSTPFAIKSMSLAQKQDIASTYPLFHWGPIAWSFYILPAIAHGYMFFIRKENKQTLSAACRPLLKEKSDGVIGKFIDVFAIVGLLSGVATTFALATPLLSKLISELFGVAESNKLTILILIVIAGVYTAAVLFGLKGIEKLANASVYLFMALAAMFLFLGPTMYIIETGLTSIGKMINEFFSMSTWMDPLRVSGSSSSSGFPQDWTVFYWAYWIAWSVATPFFIGKISEGRTIKNTILGSYFYGLLGTFTSFIVFGNFGLYQQVSGNLDAAGLLEAGKAPSLVILKIFEQLPLAKLAMFILIFVMIAFYASTFDAITLVISEYSLKNLKPGQEAPKGIKVFWSLVFIIMPIALIFMESTLSMLQTLSIIAAFPLAIIMIIVIKGFFKDIKNYTKKE